MGAPGAIDSFTSAGGGQGRLANCPLWTNHNKGSS